MTYSVKPALQVGRDSTKRTRTASTYRVAVAGVVTEVVVAAAVVAAAVAGVVVAAPGTEKRQLQFPRGGLEQGPGKDRLTQTVSV